MIVLGKPFPIRVVEVPSTEGTEGFQKVPSDKSKEDAAPEIPKQDANQANVSQ